MRVFVRRAGVRTSDGTALGTIGTAVALKEFIGGPEYGQAM